MSNFGFRSFANVLAYIAVILVGAALLVQALLGDGMVAYVFKTIADVLAYVMLAISSFSYAKSRRSVVYIIIWIVAVALIAVSYIIH
ncbi:MAG: hypothetical protein IJE91_00285 [Clostridia bacterium]|nr:hypothetical protein [Clostridia bacterium]